MRSTAASLRQPRDEGGATLMVVACTAVLMLLTLVLAVGGGWVLAQRRAQAAADLVALAAATHGCGAAGAVAQRNGSSLRACEVAGRESRVEVSVEGPAAFGLQRAVLAEARAGPATSPTS